MRQICTAAGIFLFFLRCAPHPGAEEEPAHAVTPVKTTHIATGPMQDYVLLHATSEFSIKTPVNSTIAGQIIKFNLIPGDLIQSGDLVAVIKTRESAHIGNVIKNIDSTLQYNGEVEVRATSSGYVTAVDVHAGDFVQEGQELGIISDAGGFMFVMQVPYAYRQYLPQDGNITLELPGGEKLAGHIIRALPEMNMAAQTQEYQVAVHPGNRIPENLIATVPLIKESRNATQHLPKSAVLTDEMQSRWWVMKMISDTVAVQVPVRTGMIVQDSVEIISPAFTAQDIFITEGNYGLGDTARVKVMQ